MAQRYLLRIRLGIPATHPAPPLTSLPESLGLFSHQSQQGVALAVWLSSLARGCLTEMGRKAEMQAATSVSLPP